MIPRLIDRTDRAWFSRLVRHPARKRSGSSLSTPEPATGCSSNNLGPAGNALAFVQPTILPENYSGVQTVTGTAELTNQQQRQPVAYQMLQVGYSLQAVVVAVILYYIL